MEDVFYWKICFILLFKPGSVNSFCQKYLYSSNTMASVVHWDPRRGWRQFNIGHSCCSCNVTNGSLYRGQLCQSVHCESVVPCK